MKVSRYTLPVLVSLVFLSITYFAYNRTKQELIEKRKKVFQVRVEESINILNVQMDIYVQVLKATRAMFYVKDTVTKEDWSLFIKYLAPEKNFPGIQGVGFAITGDSLRLKSIEKNIRHSGYPAFSIFPETKTDIHSPIIYIEPFSGRNLRAFGFDMSSNNERAEAMLHARDSNTAVLTSKVILIQETRVEPQPGFLIYLPVYRPKAVVKTVDQRRKELYGFTYIPFRSYDFFNVVFKPFNELSVSIYDDPQQPNTSLLYSSDTLSVFADKDLSFTKDTAINIKGRAWYLNYKSQPVLLSGNNMTEAYLILACGILVSLLVLIGGYMEVNRRESIIRELELIKTIDRNKEEFIGIASHELKTPLTSLKAYVQLMQRSINQQQFKELPIYVTKAEEYLGKLQGLINDLLDISKVTSGKLIMNKEEFDFDLFVRNVIESFRPTSTTHTMVIKGDTYAMVYADKNRVEQVLNNLLTNAIKYSPDAKKVEICLERKENNIIVTVVDFGIGIPEEKLSRIFERFYRVEKESHKYQGLGLGLYISCQVIQAHKGKMWVKSETGKGSSFSFSIPVSGNITAREFSEVAPQSTTS
jgi:two-component system, OmpR family, sensor kinase